MNRDLLQSDFFLDEIFLPFVAAVGSFTKLVVTPRVFSRGTSNWK